MTDKDKYLNFWNLVPGTEAAERAWAEKVAMNEGKRFLPLPMAFVRQDICYDSPIDGRHITNKFARQDDLARNGCIEYDPEMKKDAQRRRAEMDARIDSSVDVHVEKAWSGMGQQQKERLTNELQAGLTPEIQRLTAGG